MKFKFGVWVFISLSLSVRSNAADLVISGIYDGPLDRGNPKGVELFANNAIADLSLYGLGSAQNGGGTDGQEFTFPSVSVTAGSYLYVTYEAPLFTDFFGFAPSFTSGSMNINGDDAIELFFNGTAIDCYGVISVDGTGQSWEYTGGWAYAASTHQSTLIFNPGDWIYSGIDGFGSALHNSDLGIAAMPIGTYSPVPEPASAALGIGVLILSRCLMSYKRTKGRLS
jgi:hypothetical protein